MKDSLANTDAPSLINSVATGIIPNVTGAPGGSGHWNGLRIVDGIAGGDKDIFLTGGKENDLRTWNIGPGTVGSAKYDITQAYLANNQDSLFFGMERRGNNGTTAFDFEFNQFPPNPATPTIPTRMVGDVLFTFELMGSGSSGAAVPHYYLWNGSAYIERLPRPPSLISSINQIETPAAPWGFVNSRGGWVLGNIMRFGFAEASVKLSEAFPDFDPCDNALYVQVRTRSAASATSDLKDATRIFAFRFAGPQPIATYGHSCLAEFTYDGSTSKDSTGGSNVTYFWSFTPPAGVTLTGAGITGPDGAGAYHSTSVRGLVNVNLPAGVESAVIGAVLTVSESAGCSSSTGITAVTVAKPLSVLITQKIMDGSTFTVTLTGNASSSAALQWQRFDGVNWVNIPGATSATLAYSSFETDATPTVQDFTIDGGAYQGQIWQVPIRLHASGKVNGEDCEADSAPITLKKVVAVDP